MGSKMDPKDGCNNDIDIHFNPMLTLVTQVSCILVISHFFQICLRPLGQPAPVAQILAGLVISPSGLSRIQQVETFFMQSSTDYYEATALSARVIIMFLIGLEMDLPYLRRNLRPASIIASTTCFLCTLFAAAITPFMYLETKQIGYQHNKVLMALVITVVLANTASPFVVQVAADLKFGNSEIGRLAISASLLCDVYAVILLIIVNKFNKKEFSVMQFISLGLLYLVIVIGVIFVNLYLVKWLNKRNRNNKYLKSTEIFVLLAILFVCAMALESMGYSSIFASFLIGTMFPRGGKATRTLLIKLTYLVQNFVLPIYFGYAGFKAYISEMNSLARIVVVVIVILLSIGAKVAGTLAACYLQKIPLNEGILLSFLLNLKGHVDLLTLAVGIQSRAIFSLTFYRLMTTVVVLNSLIFGPLVTFMVKRERDITGYKHIDFASINTDSELRLLACVHSPRSVATMIGLIETSRGSENVAITPYLMQLIELPEKTTCDLMYHQKEEDELSDDEAYGHNDVVEINETVDIFTEDTGMMIHQVKVVSPFPNMHEHVCELAEEIRASIVILPFHKHQRIDGKLETGKKGIRESNQKVLRHAKCTVSVLVDRRLTAQSSRSSGTESSHHIATLFIGGPDDREALGFSKRLGLHHNINLTVVRILPTSAKKDNVGVNIPRQDKNVLMTISDSGTEDEKDTAVLTEFYNSYVTSGQVLYVEKYVQNGEETASALKDMADIYSMMIVGRGGRGNSVLTCGMSDWEECPELGKVGDFLASTEFDKGSSVLIVQQYSHNQNENNDADGLSS